MRKKKDWINIGTITFTVLFFISAIVFEIYELGSLPGQFYGALIGVVITAIITVLLLKGQTKSEESREIHLKVFDKKQEIYFNFLSKLNNILQQEELLQSLNDRHSIINNQAINIQDLLFEIGYLQMHASPEAFNHVMDHVANIMEANNKLLNEPAHEDSLIHEYYTLLTHNFFKIVGHLKDDLYGYSHEPIDLSKINQVLIHSLEKSRSNKTSLNI